MPTTDRQFKTFLDDLALLSARHGLVIGSAWDGAMVEQMGNEFSGYLRSPDGHLILRDDCPAPAGHIESLSVKRPDASPATPVVTPSLADNDEEEWRPVPGRPDVRGSSLGRVHRIHLTETRGAKSKPTFGTKVSQKTGSGGTYTKYVVQWLGHGLLLVSRLVAAAFHGPAPFPGAVVLHLDDNSLNNRPSNLKWGTQRENLSTETSKPRLDEARRNAVRSRWERARKAA